MMETGGPRKLEASESEILPAKPGSDDTASVQSDSSDDADIEPILKYRLAEGEALQNLFDRDRISAIATVSGVIALGTHNGAVLVLDWDFKLRKRVRAHGATIHDISIDATGEFIATASMDGA